MPESNDITALLPKDGLLITYSPLRTEVDWSLVLPNSTVIPTHQIPSRASLDPIEEAHKVMAAASNSEVVMLIPGRAFDSSGTRHGQGGGWYDRFLALVPREWLRIGFCYLDQFSPTPLRREQWDQAMDYVVVVDRETNRIRLYSAEGEPS